MELSFKKLIFISGKGGVGKTTLALLLSKSLALKGKRVLYVELNPRSSARSLAGLTIEPQYKPQKTQYLFDASLLSGGDCLVDYVGSFIRVEKLIQPFFESSMIQGLINLAPGLKDLAVLGKLTSEMRNHGPSFNYDHIVVDSYSTGHFLSFLQSPELLGQSVSSGPLRTQSEGIEKVLKDPQMTQFIFVSLLEALPLDELEETLENFRPRFKNQIQIFINKWINLNKLGLTIDDPLWRKFITERLTEQDLQFKRLSDFLEPLSLVELMTSDLSIRLNLSQGEFLRKLSKSSS